MLFAGQEVCKIVPSVYVWTSVLMQDLRHSFSQYGPPGRQITYNYLFPINHFKTFPKKMKTVNDT